MTPTALPDPLAPHAFPPDLAVPVTNARSGTVYTLIRADALPDAPEVTAQLVAACNEPAIYDWLFRERCQGRPYREADAEGFFSWMRAGWSDATHFVFALRSPGGELAGVLDIKSADLDSAEVGYWLRERHSGVMVGALHALEVLAWAAGYRALYARVRPGNRRSQAVLQRAGWQLQGLEAGTPSEGGEYLRYTR
jgi:RimJ/RimL family protein N-acetyltransferase